MRKLGKILVATIICITTLGSTCLAADSGTAEVQDVMPLTRSEEQAGEVIDVVYFEIAANGKVDFFDEKPSAKSTRLEDPVIGSYVYTYHGLDGNKKPKYSVKLSMVSKTKLKKSVLSTKAENVTSWNNKSANHSTKIASNTRTYVYSKNAPSNPYCKAKSSITISDGTTYKIPETTLRNAIGK